MIRPSLCVSTLGAAAAAAILVAGCANAPGPVRPAAVEKPDLTVAAVPSLDSAGLYIAQQRGLFAAEGLHVKIVPAASSSIAIAGQLAGKYDVTVGGYVSYILADALHHADLRVLAAASILQPNSQEIVVPPGSPIESPSQLKGKKIGINVLDNIAVILVSSVLADNGISPSQVHFVPIPFPQMAAALKAHRVDAAYLPEPFLTSAELTAGAQPLADTDQGVTGSLPISGFVVTQKWAEKYPRTAAAFRRAVIAAQTIADSSLSAVQRSMVAFADVPPGTAALVSPPQYPLQADPILLQRVADLMREFGLLRQSFGVRPMLR
jgi:NitT/TauT family transport system substrate-binding protein